MTVTPQAGSVDDPDRSFGYAPELKRTLSSFQVFAISFASVSVVIGIFGTYDDVLQTPARWASGCSPSSRSARSWWRWCTPSSRRASR